MMADKKSALFKLAGTNGADKYEVGKYQKIAAASLAKENAARKEPHIVVEDTKNGKIVTEHPTKKAAMEHGAAIRRAAGGPIAWVHSVADANKLGLDPRKTGAKLAPRTGGILNLKKQEGEAHLELAKFHKSQGNINEYVQHQVAAERAASAAGMEWDEEKHPRNKDGKFSSKLG
jgi:hypothetical protein